MASVKKIILAAVLAVFSIASSGQELAQLKDDSDYTVGRLANGMDYYLYKNTSDGSVADMALVQKGRRYDPSVRVLLSEMPSFHSIKPYKFLARNGIRYSSYGYSYSNELATVFRFNDVPMSDGFVADSTFMLMFGMALSHPYTQAIVISGDIDKDKLVERMQLLSMVVTPRIPVRVNNSFSFKPDSSVKQILTRNSSADLCHIGLAFTTDRINEKDAGTVIPFMMGRYSNQFGYIAMGRLRRAFSLAGVSMTDLDFSYSDSSCSPGAEKYVIEFTVRDSDLSSAVSVLATVLSQMERRGVTFDEMEESARAVSHIRNVRTADVLAPNSVYVEKCISKYLYGSSLASPESVLKQVGGKQMDRGVELGLYNSYLSALLGANGGFELDCSLPAGDLSNPDLGDLFSRSWKEAVCEGVQTIAMTPLDTTALDVTLRKTKIKSEVTEPMTGGKLWTFNNGIRVVYKKVGGGNRFSYAMVLKGGADAVQDLRNGEMAFLSDMLFENSISGLGQEDFRRELAINGIVLDADVTYSDFRLTGSAPSESLGKVVGMLYDIGYARGREKFDYQSFVKREKLISDAVSITPSGISDFISESLSRNGASGSLKRVENIGRDLHSRANAYFDDEFSKCNDGILVFIGDISEDTLKDLLCRELGSFQVSGRHSYRGSSFHEAPAQWSTWTLPGTPGVSVGLKAMRGYSVAQFISFNLAIKALERELAVVCADLGATYDLTFDDGNLYIRCEACGESGLPSTVSPAGTGATVAAIRKCLTTLAAGGVSQPTLASCKSRLQAEMTCALSDSDELMLYTISRYIAGRDFLTNFKDALKQVGASDVQVVLKQFSEAPRVEVISR